MKQTNTKRSILAEAAAAVVVAGLGLPAAHADPTFLNSFGGPGTTGTSDTQPGKFYYLYDLALAPNGNVYATEQVAQPAYVSVFSPTGTYLTRFRANSGTLNSGYFAGIGINQQGVGYVACNQQPYRLYTFSTTSNTITGAINSGNGTTQFGAPGSVAVGPFNSYFVLDGIQRDIQVYDSTGAYKMTVGSAGYGDGQFIGPADVSIGPSGQVYVVDANLNRVEMFNADGTFRTTIGSSGSGNGQFNQPYFVQSSAGTARLYVSDTGNKRVEVFTGDGTYVSSFGSAPGSGQILSPGGIALADNGMIYVADADPSKACIDRFFDPYEWSSGTNTFTDPSIGPTTVGVGPGQLLGTSFALDPSKGLTATAVSVVAGGGLTLSGGSLTTSALNVSGAGAGLLVNTASHLSIGSLSISGGGKVDLSNSSSATLPGSIVVNDAASTLLVRQGSTLRSASISIGAGASAALSGNALLATTGNVVNNGNITLAASELSADNGIQNSGSIVGDGAMSAGAGGITNTGMIGLAGNSHVTGNVNNTSSGTIKLSGVTPNVFFNDVTNDGTINIDAGSGATFYGTFSGTRGTTGGGTAFFDGPVSPGPANPIGAPRAISFDGNVTFHADASIVEELGGTVRGATYDSIDVGNHATLAGTINVRTVYGFVPLPGQQFLVMNFWSHDGDVSVVNQTPYEGLRFTKTYTQNALYLTPTALPGDANLSGIVDTLDFNALAANFGGTGKNWLQADFNGDGVVDTLDFNSLAANFGKETPPEAAPAAALVPEPSTALSFAFGAAALIGSARRRRLRPRQA